MTAVASLNPQCFQSHNSGAQSNTGAYQSPQMTAMHTPAATPSHFLEEGMLIVDPMTRKMVIPYENIYETRAFQRGTVPSLCMLFQQHKCRQGPMCYQVHADPAVIYELRARIPQRTACCLHHGKQSPAELAKYAEKTLKVADVNYNDGNIPVDRFAMTVGLKKSLEGSEMATICRAGNVCRFHEECKFLHLCRELEAYYTPSHNPSSIPNTPTMGGQHFHSQHDLMETPTTLGASMASLGNSFSSLPSTPVMQSQMGPRIPESPPQITKEGTWCHDPYQWRCMGNSPVQQK